MVGLVRVALLRGGLAESVQYLAPMWLAPPLQATWPPSLRLPSMSACWPTTTVSGSCCGWRAAGLQLPALHASMPGRLWQSVWPRPVQLVMGICKS